MSRRLPVVLAAVAVVGLVALALAAVVVGVRPAEPDPRRAFVVAGYTALWDDRSVAAVGTALEQGVTEISPTWGTIRSDGQLDSTPLPDGLGEELRRPGVQVLATVQNYRDGAWHGALVADVLGNPQRAAEHRRALVDAALENGWDGVDIDYESLPPTAGTAFGDFLAALRDDLHEHGLLLSVAVPARTGDAEEWARAYDYRRLGEVADQVRVMAYDRAWSGSAAGPVAPLPWVEEVVAYAVDRIPRSKLMLGLATYGYDWVGTEGTYLSATDLMQVAEEVGETPRWDGDAAASTFGYRADGEQHTVWFEDARSLEIKLDVAVREGLRGAAIWQLGGEDPRLWPSVAAATAEDHG
jgi:spore germination protein